MEISIIKKTLLFLRKNYTNNIITNIYILDGKYYNMIPYGFDSLYYLLPLTIKGFYSKGLLIYVELYSKKRNKTIYIILYMKTSKINKFSNNTSKMKFVISNNDNLYINDYYDMYIIKFIDSSHCLEQEKKMIGIDILSKEFTFSKWKSIINNNLFCKICDLLDNQSIISGCGAYIRNEVLYYSCVVPEKIINEIHVDKLDKIYEGLLLIPRLMLNISNYKFYNINEYIKNYKNTHNNIHITEDFYTFL